VAKAPNDYLLEVSTDLPKDSDQSHWLRIGCLGLEGCQVTPSGFFHDTLRSHSARQYWPKNDPLRSLRRAVLFLTGPTQS
jgi:hypothetical protein